MNDLSSANVVPIRIVDPVSWDGVTELPARSRLAPEAVAGDQTVEPTPATPDDAEPPLANHFPWQGFIVAFVNELAVDPLSGELLGQGDGSTSSRGSDHGNATDGAIDPGGGSSAPFASGSSSRTADRDSSGPAVAASSDFTGGSFAGGSFAGGSFGGIRSSSCRRFRCK